MVNALITAKWANNIAHNALTLSYRWMLAGGASYTDGTTALTSDVQAALAETFATGNVYTMQIVVKDSLDSTTYTLTIPKGKPILMIDVAHGSVGFGSFPMKDNTVENWGVERWHGNLEAVNGSTTLTLTMERLIALLSDTDADGWTGRYLSGKKIYRKILTGTKTNGTNLTLQYGLTATMAWVDMSNSWVLDADGVTRYPMAETSSNTIYLRCYAQLSSVFITSATIYGSVHIVILYTID